MVAAGECLVGKLDLLLHFYSCRGNQVVHPVSREGIPDAIRKGLLCL